MSAFSKFNVSNAEIVWEPHTRRLSGFACACGIHWVVWSL